MQRVDRAVRVVIIVAAMITSLEARNAAPESLVDHLIDMVPPTRLTITADNQSIDLNAGRSTAASAAADAIQRLAIRGIDFPVASTVPGFSYVYDPNLQAFTKSKRLGPVFSEKTETVGQGRFEVGANYLYADLDRVDGHEFGDTLGIQGFVQLPNGDIDVVAQAIRFTSFRLVTNQINVYSTYGITDRWDVNILLPLMYTQLHARAQVVYALLDSKLNLVAQTSAQKIGTDADAFGAGDLLVRTKYRFTDGDFSLAGALTIRLPTGNENDFQGLGDVTVTPTLIAEVPLGPVSFHGTLGFEVNADDLERTRARYTIGGAYQALDNLALLLDVLGSSSFVPDSFTLSGHGLGFAPGIDTTGVNTAEVPQSNVVDLATGLKLSMGEHALFYIGAIVPLTRDGLRASVIPTGGIEVGF